MTLKIERATEKGVTVLRLMGRLGVEHLEELKAQIAASDSSPVLNLEEVNLVDVEAVRCLVLMQRGGIEVRNASPYIREWMNRCEGTNFKGAR